MKSVFEKFEQEKHVLGRLGGSDFCLLLEDKMQEEIEKFLHKILLMK